MAKSKDTIPWSIYKPPTNGGLGSTGGPGGPGSGTPRQKKAAKKAAPKKAVKKK